VIAGQDREAHKFGYSTLGSKIIDVDEVELVSAKAKESGPVLVVRFDVYQVEVLRDREGEVISGSPVRRILSIPSTQLVITLFRTRQSRIHTFGPSVAM